MEGVCTIEFARIAVQRLIRESVATARIPRRLGISHHPEEAKKPKRHNVEEI